MLNFEITYKDHTFQGFMLENGKKIVDFYASDARFYDDEFDCIKEEVKQILGMVV
jgi:hypothetical protein